MLNCSPSCVSPLLYKNHKVAAPLPVIETEQECARELVQSRTFLRPKESHKWPTVIFCRFVCVVWASFSFSILLHSLTIDSSPICIWFNVVTFWHHAAACWLHSFAGFSGCSSRERCQVGMHPIQGWLFPFSLFAVGSRANTMCWCRGKGMPEVGIEGRMREESAIYVDWMPKELWLMHWLAQRCDADCSR